MNSLEIVKPRRKTAKAIIGTYAISMLSMFGAIASVLTVNLELAALCVLSFGISGLVCFICCIIGFVILYKNEEGVCASSWIATLVATAILPVQPESVGFDLSTLAALGFMGCTIWGVIKLWQIGGQAPKS